MPPRPRVLKLAQPLAELPPFDAETGHTFAFTLYGARIGIRSNRAAALKLLESNFPPGWRASSTSTVDWLFTVIATGAARPTYTLYNNAERVVHTRRAFLFTDSFEREVQLAVAQAARGKIFVHAGVVGWRGQAILMPARSFNGKSTLTRALVDAGATYYSDEYAVLDPQGRVHPFARPLALRDHQLVNRKLSFEALGGTIGIKPLPVGLVVIAKYRENARWNPRPLTPGQGVLELLANTVNARTKQQESLATLAAVMTRAQAIKGIRGEATPVARDLLDRVDKQVFTP